MEKNILDKIREALLLSYLSRKWIVTMFIVINLVFLVIGLNWQKAYSSHTTIYIEEENILGPLMQGTAVQTEVVDRGRMAREIIFGRQIMMKILELGGWMKNEPTPIEQERLMKEIESRTEIANVGPNLVSISYKDSIPERAYSITKGFADLFIEGSLQTKVLESQAAFEFIDKQVMEYEKKLKESEEALKKFRTENVDFREGAEIEVSRRITQYRSNIEDITQQLREATIRKDTIESQLSGETETAVGLSRAEQMRSRIAELQSNLDVLQLSYHETYPDIIQIKNQIIDLKNSLVEEEERRKKERKEAKKRGEMYIDESIRANPIYQQLQSELYQTKTLIATLEVRIRETEKLLVEELERDRRINSAEATLTSLTRDYNVNRDVYQDLLRRRENARVSMNLDREHQGLSLNINEPAFYPHSPSGPRFLHFVIGGFVLGIILPLGVFYMRQQIFPRIYNKDDIANTEGLLVLGELSHFTTKNELLNNKREIITLSSITFAILLTIIIISIQRYFISE